MAETPKEPKIVAPKGFTAAKQADFCFRIRLGVARADAATEVGFKARQIFDFIDKSDDFRTKVEAAEIDAVETALFRGAMEGKTVAQKTWLEMRGRKQPTDMGEGFKADGDKPAEPADPFEAEGVGSNVRQLRGTGRAAKSTGGK